MKKLEKYFKIIFDLFWDWSCKIIISLTTPLPQGVWRGTASLWGPPCGRQKSAAAVCPWRPKHGSRRTKWPLWGQNNWPLAARQGRAGPRPVEGQYGAADAAMCRPLCCRLWKGVDSSPLPQDIVSCDPDTRFSTSGFFHRTTPPRSLIHRLKTLTRVSGA
jgi:hypothetical protein